MKTTIKILMIMTAFLGIHGDARAIMDGGAGYAQITLSVADSATEHRAVRAAEKSAGEKRRSPGT